MTINDNKSTTSVLCVDLDGTLIKSDILVESALTYLKSKPYSVFQLAFLFLKGRKHLKNFLANKVNLNYELLPYNEDVIDFIKLRNSQGQKTYLTTATHEKFAKAISKHLGIFDGVLATNHNTNLKGKNKLKKMKETWPDTKIEYIGDAKADFKIWSSGIKAHVVGNKSFIKKVRKRYDIGNIFFKRELTLKIIIRLLRVHQWVKNFLLFVPLILSTNFMSLEKLGLTFIAFICFSFLASSTYIINDLLDLEADRSHHTKKNRPIPSGIISLHSSLMISTILATSSLALSFYLPFSFQIAMLCYLVITLNYSFWLKQVALIDVICLGILFTSRILAGNEATAIHRSPWLLALSMFLFLSLGFVKRYSELFNLKKNNKEKAIGRGYLICDLPIVGSMGMASGCLAVLVLALYMNSQNIVVQYSSPDLLWLLCPTFLYWIGRMWFTAGRGNMNEDPVLFAVKDKVTYIVAWITLSIIFLAK